jgi:hypothetical protein
MEKSSVQQLQTISAQAVVAGPTLFHSEKLQLAAKLVEEVAFEHAGHESAKVIEHLILVAASLQKLTQRQDEIIAPLAGPVLVTT